MWEQCRDLQDELVAMRRELHRIPELGGDLPQTKAYVAGKLTEMGIPFVENKTDSGLVALIQGGKPGRTIALRADMDALPITEENEVPYKSTHEGCMHACGHDTHMTMLLGAAKVLNAHKDQIPGTVKLLFQTDEEGSKGAQRICEEGHLDSVDAIFGTHIGTIISKDIPAGTVICTPGCCMASFDRFVIKVKGFGCHGSTPEKGADAMLAMVSLAQSLQTVITRERSPLSPCVMTLGILQSGTAFNILPSEAYLEGSIRVLDEALREKNRESVRRMADACRFRWISSRCRTHRW